MIRASTLDIVKHTRIYFLQFVPKLNLVKTQYQRNSSTDSDNYPNFDYTKKSMQQIMKKERKKLTTMIEKEHDQA